MLVENSTNILTRYLAKILLSCARAHVLVRPSYPRCCLVRAIFDVLKRDADAEVVCVCFECWCVPMQGLFFTDKTPENTLREAREVEIFHRAHTDFTLTDERISELPTCQPGPTTFRACMRMSEF